MLRSTFCLMTPRWNGSRPKIRGLSFSSAALVAAAYFAQADEPFVRHQFQDGPQKVAGMNARVVTELRVEGNRHGASLQIDDFHGRTCSYSKTTRAGLSLQCGSFCGSTQ